MFANKCVRNALAVAAALAIFLVIVSSITIQSILGIVIVSLIAYYICYSTSSEKNTTAYYRE